MPELSFASLSNIETHHPSSLFVGRDLRSSGEVESPKNEDLAAVVYAFNPSTREASDLSSRTARGFAEKLRSWKNKSQEGGKE